MVHPYFIGISGGSASGKTRFLNELRDLFPENELCIISQDDYYKPLEQQQKDASGMVNYDLPEAIDEQQFFEDISHLLIGNSIRRREYVFNNPGKAPGWKEFAATPVIVVEGLFIFHFERIKKLLGLKIFIDAADEIKLQRRLLRDERERGIPRDSILYQWHNHVLPAYASYLLPYREEADIIITNHTGYDKGLELVSDHIKLNILRYKG